MTFLRAIRFALNNMYRNIWLSTATILIMVLTLTSIVLVGAVNLVGTRVIEAIEEKVDVTAYFYPDVSEDAVLQVQRDLNALESVASVEYVSRDQALEEFTQRFDNNEAIQETLSILDENPLGAHLIVQAASLDDFSAVLEALRSPAYEDLISKRDFQDQQVLVSRLDLIRGRVQQVGLIISAVFVFIAILVIFNTIRITIYSQREEIGIQRLVGATGTFIRAPYVVEAGLYAVFSSLLTIGILYPILRAVGPKLTTFFEGYDLDLFTFYSDNLLALLLLLTILGLFLSIVSSMVAISRYLRV